MQREFSVLPYNLVVIDKDLQKCLVDYFDDDNVGILKNPTYKTFEDIDQHVEIKNLMDSIYYLPNLHKLSNNEIIYLAEYLKRCIKFSK